MRILERDDVLPALLRPGMYAGEQAWRTEKIWLADAVVAYLNSKMDQLDRNPYVSWPREPGCR